MAEEQYVHYLHGDMKAKVNWYNKERGELGVTLTEIEEPKGFKVLQEDEVDFRYGEVTPDPTREIDEQDITKEVEEDYESLRERIKRLRKERQDLGKNKRKKTRKKKKRKKTPKQMLSSLSEEEKEKIKELLGN